MTLDISPSEGACLIIALALAAADTRETARLYRDIGGLVTSHRSPSAAQLYDESGVLAREAWARAWDKLAIQVDDYLAKLPTPCEQ